MFDKKHEVVARKNLSSDASQWYDSLRTDTEKVQEIPSIKNNRNLFEEQKITKIILFCYQAIELLPESLQLLYEFQY
jgi:hypothetical protein